MASIDGVRRFFRIPLSASAQAKVDVSAELRFHLEMRAEELVERGLAHHQAREQALDEFGDLDHTRRYCRKMSVRKERKDRSMNWLRDLYLDIRHAVRLLGRNKGFTAVVVLTIGLGIGANTAIFSVINAVLLSPFPYDQPERLVTVWESNPEEGLPFMTASTPNYVDWREQNQVFSEMAAFHTRDYFLETSQGTINIQGTRVTASAFPLLRVEPHLGRLFDEQDELPDSEPVVVLSHGL